MILIFLNISFIGYTYCFFNTVDTNCAANAIDLFLMDLSTFSSFVAFLAVAIYGSKLCNFDAADVVSVDSVVLLVIVVVIDV